MPAAGTLALDYLGGPGGGGAPSPLCPVGPVERWRRIQSCEDLQCSVVGHRPVRIRVQDKCWEQTLGEVRGGEAIVARLTRAGAVDESDDWLLGELGFVERGGENGSSLNVIRTDKLKDVCRPSLKGRIN